MVPSAALTDFAGVLGDLSWTSVRTLLNISQLLRVTCLEFSALE